jgi:hypothetical protein
MLALAFLTITAATEHARSPAPAGQIPLTRSEIAALFATLVIQPVRDAWHRLRWSTWRRRHQHRAKTCHYQRGRVLYVSGHCPPYDAVASSQRAARAVAPTLAATAIGGT